MIFFASILLILLDVFNVMSVRFAFSVHLTEGRMALLRHPKIRNVILYYIFISNNIYIIIIIIISNQFTVIAKIPPAMILPVRGLSIC